VWRGTPSRGAERERIAWDTPIRELPRHGLPQELVQNIAVVDGLAKAAAE
jgi:hypothetical protein